MLCTEGKQGLVKDLVHHMGETGVDGAYAAQNAGVSRYMEQRGGGGGRSGSKEKEKHEQQPEYYPNGAAATKAGEKNSCGEYSPDTQVKAHRRR